MKSLPMLGLLTALAAGALIPLSLAQEPAKAAPQASMKPSDGLRVALGQLDALQQPDGSWAGEPRATALVLLAYTGDGSTLMEGPYRAQVRKGYTWLLGKAGEGFDLGGGNPQTHAIATGALAECALYSTMPKAQQVLKKALERLATLDVAASSEMLTWSSLAAATARDAKVPVPKALSAALDKAAAQRPEADHALAGACLAYARWFGKQAPEAWTAALDGSSVPTRITDEQLAFRFHAHFQVSAETWGAWFRKLLPIAWHRTQKAIAPGEEAEAGPIESLALAALCFEAPYRLARVTGE